MWLEGFLDEPVQADVRVIHARPGGDAVSAAALPVVCAEGVQIVVTRHAAVFVLKTASSEVAGTAFHLHHLYLDDAILLVQGI